MRSSECSGESAHLLLDYTIGTTFLCAGSNILWAKYLNLSDLHKNDLTCIKKFKMTINMCVYLETLCRFRSVENVFTQLFKMAALSINPPSVHFILHLQLVHLLLTKCTFEI